MVVASLRRAGDVKRIGDTLAVKETRVIDPQHPNGPLIMPSVWT